VSLLVLALLLLPAWSFAADALSAVTNGVPQHPFPGITWHAEGREQPAMRWFVAEIEITNPAVKIRVAPGGPDPDGPGKWQTTLMQPTRIAAREGFDLVINGDFFDARGVKDAEGTNSQYRTRLWGAANGPAVTDGRTWSTSTSSKPCLVVHKDGRVTIQALQQPTPDDWEVIAGNTMLVADGAVVPHFNKVRHPRTAVGLDTSARHLIIMVVDGRKPHVAVGMSYDELAAGLIRLGCRQAMNLDGGGSSVIALRDPDTGQYRILNQPTDGHERAVANALGVSVQ
jgi:exopolysaccharide biosynthesis protein